MASTVNDGFAAELDQLEKEADQMILLRQQIKARVVAMMQRATIDWSLVFAMNEATKPEESELSRNLSSLVTDLPDFDHWKLTTVSLN